ncbi:MAG: hypothetical protein H6737_29020 [Alphaproteobacteria bacterium]|nr:hypothetical protein [Alphaproteobacteria bacterium]
MKIEVPDGDVVDRITILELKRRHLADPAKRAHVETELAALHFAWSEQTELAFEAVPGLPRLREVNAELWDVEDALRALERAADFGPRFVALARSVYGLNDERARIKAAISEYTGSLLREQKGYV